MSELPKPSYLGDGVYASFDGYQVWVKADRDGFEHRVAIEPEVMGELIKYWGSILRFYKEKQRDNLERKDRSDEGSGDGTRS